MRPPEEVKRALVRQWLDKAEADVGTTDRLASGGSRYLEAACFHAQQAAEKFLKAYLVQHQIEFPKTHDLDEILDLVAKADGSLADSLREAAALSPYGVDIRYPGDFPEVTAKDAQTALDLAGKVREAVLGALGLPGPGGRPEEGC